MVSFNDFRDAARLCLTTVAKDATFKYGAMGLVRVQFVENATDSSKHDLELVSTDRRNATQVLFPLTDDEYRELSEGLLGSLHEFNGSTFRYLSKTGLANITAQYKAGLPCGDQLDGEMLSKSCEQVAYPDLPKVVTLIDAALEAVNRPLPEREPVGITPAALAPVFKAASMARAYKHSALSTRIVNSGIHATGKPLFLFEGRPNNANKASYSFTILSMGSSAF